MNSKYGMVKVDFITKKKNKHFVTADCVHYYIKMQKRGVFKSTGNALEAGVILVFTICYTPPVTNTVVNAKGL
jgi:hypothetical protein